MLTPEPKAVYPKVYQGLDWSNTQFQCSPLSRRLCTLFEMNVEQVDLGISVLTPEPKAVYLDPSDPEPYVAMVNFSAHP